MNTSKEAGVSSQGLASEREALAASILSNIDRVFLSGGDEYEHLAFRIQLRAALSSATGTVGGGGVAKFMGMRSTPKGTREFWGYVMGSHELREGDDLYATPVQQAAVSGHVARDAERLEFAQIHGVTLSCDGVNWIAEVPIKSDPGSFYIYTGETPDSAIDAALAAINTPALPGSGE